LPGISEKVLARRLNVRGKKIEVPSKECRIQPPIEERDAKVKQLKNVGEDQPRYEWGWTFNNG
jgi:hypothetical protein